MVRNGHIPIVVLAVAVVAACTPLGGESAPEPTVGSTLAVPEVTEPPARQTDFCQIMLDLHEQFPEDQPISDADADAILAAYREALEVAPSEVAPDLEAVIAATDDGTDVTDPTTTPPSTIGTESTEADFLDREYTPGDNPAIRLNDYVDLTCRGNLNNPGPPPTQPGATPPSTDPDAGT